MAARHSLRAEEPVISIRRPREAFALQWGSALASRGTVDGCADARLLDRAAMGLGSREPRNGNKADNAASHVSRQWGSALASRGTLQSDDIVVPMPVPQWGSALASRGTRRATRSV